MMQTNSPWIAAIPALLLVAACAPKAEDPALTEQQNACFAEAGVEIPEGGGFYQMTDEQQKIHAECMARL